MSIGVRGLDTAYNYAGFASHRMLARTAGDLLPEFALSTKVGFFPHGEGSEQSLDPARLRNAVNESADELGIAPDVIFLHSPERTLADLTPREGLDRLVDACAVLADTTAAGLCGSWGITSWDPLPLLAVLEHDQSATHPPAPDVLMVRAGLSVADEVLSASESVAEHLGVSPGGRWGMSPFGGSTANEVWHTANLHTFLRPGQGCSNLQAAFRVAYETPRVAQMAVGVSSPAHLHELLTATRLRVNDEAIGRYRRLISAEHPTPGCGCRELVRGSVGDSQLGRS